MYPRKTFYFTRNTCRPNCVLKFFRIIYKIFFCYTTRSSFSEIKKFSILSFLVKKKKPPPPIPAENEFIIPMVIAEAIAASTAFPPFSIIFCPILEATGHSVFITYLSYSLLCEQLTIKLLKLNNIN
ncbi:hypothetical protein EHP00_2633 [Ecytonucleospora hepatopenaei]|uniref:Uncharacterized protein n=1 Tax=Ecytonucleospora hepatopenaei TaxID=646526 RepID=A0A1W0E2G1_9MICR|nr:hypothetical protein EHP00_2633 [Ecytonucleospora hepatopenaei]